MLLLFGLQLWLLAATSSTDAASNVRVVTPDLAGMIYPLSSTTQVVQFGDPSSSIPSAYDFVAPTPDSFTCTATRLCLELQISSVFELDPFYLHGYDANTPLVSATFDDFASSDILPIIPGSSPADAKRTKWRFQTSSSSSSASTAPASIDLLLRLRQRSQRRSARDQLLLRVRVERKDSSTTSVPVESRSAYGNQRVTHTATRVDSNAVQVQLSIMRNAQKRDVDLSDSYPVIESTSSAPAVDTSSGTSLTACDTCGGYLDACREIAPCQETVLPCLVSQLEAMASGAATSASGSGDADAGSYSSSQSAMEAVDAGEFGGNDSYDLEAWYQDFFTGSERPGRFLTELDGEQEESTTAINSDSNSGSLDAGSGSGYGETGGTKQVDLLGPFATCVADLPISTWGSLREGFVCLARSKCALGVAPGEFAGEEVTTYLRLTDGFQKFVISPTISGVNLTIRTRGINENSAETKEYSYSASAEDLGDYLRSFVLSRAAQVSAVIEPCDVDSSDFLMTLTYSEALMLSSLQFYTKDGQVTMLENSPAQVLIEYPASSPQPVLDILVRELRARTQPDQDTTHSWRLAPECLACSAQVFGCSTQAVADHSCSYEAMRIAFGQCVELQLPTSLYETMMQGSGSGRPVTAELSRCVVNTASSSTDKLYAIMQASSGLACFASTRCPFGPIRLVQDAMAIVLEATSYIHVIRVLLSSSTGMKNIKIEYKVDNTLIGTTAPISSTASELEIQQAIEVVLASAGIGVSVSSWIGTTATTEWTLEIVYRNVFLPSFAANAVADEALVRSGAMKQIVMEGGEAELRVVPRDRLKINREDLASSSGSHGVDSSSSPPSEGSGQASGSNSGPSSKSTSMSSPGSSSSSNSGSGPGNEDSSPSPSPDTSSGSSSNGNSGSGPGNEDSSPSPSPDTSSGSSYNGNSGSGPGIQDPGDANFPSSSGSNVDEGPSNSGSIDAGYDSSSGSDADEGPSNSGELGPNDAGYDSSSGSDVGVGPDAGYASSSGSGSPNPSGSGTLGP